MKKLFAVAILGLAAVSSWAQGTVDFRNGGITFPTAANRYVYNAGAQVGPGDATDAANRVTGTNMVAGLWFVVGAGSPVTAALPVGGIFGFRAPTTADANKGTWVVPAGSSPTFTLVGVDVGASATLQVRVWDGALFGRTAAGFAAAVAAGGITGTSAPFDYTVPAAGSTPDKYYMNNLRAFALAPEPSDRKSVV